MFCLRANFSADGIRRRLREVLPKGLFPTGAGDILLRSEDGLSYSEIAETSF